MQLARFASFTALTLALSTAASACVRNDFGIFEDVGCASEALASADRDLNKRYEVLLRSLEPDQKRLLVQSQRAWLAFLRAQAAFIYSIEGDGSSGRLVVTNATEEQTRIRMKALASWTITK